MASIRKRNGRWQVQVRRTGQRPISKTFQHKSDALQWAREQEVQADRGALTIDGTLLRKTTLGQLVDRYIDEVTPLKRSAIAESYVLMVFRQHRICKLALRELSSAHFAEYRDERLQSISPSGLKREFTVLKHIFTVATRDWAIPLTQNPVTQVRFNVAEIRRDRRLRNDEFQKLQDCARKSRNPNLLPVVLFVETAMRRGEILNLGWTDIEFERSLLKIREAKNGYSRTIPLTAKALEILANQPRHCSRVFPTTGNAIRLGWEKLVRRAGIGNLHFHDLRHEAISRFFEMGLTVPEVASISGHRDPRMLLRYAHADRQRVLGKLCSH
ncbi:tyrosine-type recombinase/integrase [Chelativorans sp. YIM 93263]|uniref:tyrosine-type recombinase/integrase n=1 Tax=Chelativorans sp. YIM 93263 TaxID=2906648 RepID=UPI002378469C|nr:site-specific integrase [Chelativorans sp. YIM 93263]